MPEQAELNLEEAVEKRRRRTSKTDRGSGQDAKSDDAAAVLHLPTLYRKAARQADAAETVEQATSGGTIENKLRRIVHFVEEYENWRGHTRWRQVVTIEPGLKSWIAHTIDPNTGIPDSYEVFGPNVDPYIALSEGGETVVDTYYHKRHKRGLKRRWFGYRILTSVDLAKFHTGFDIPRVKRPHQLREWLLEMQPATRAPGPGAALRRGLRAFLGDYVAPGGSY